MRKFVNTVLNWRKLGSKSKVERKYKHIDIFNLKMYFEANKTNQKNKKKVGQEFFSLVSVRI